MRAGPARHRRRLEGVLLLLVAALTAVPLAAEGEAHSRDRWASAATARHLAPPERIPAFARLFRTACSTCHTAAPKLNVLGESFRLAGYRFPDTELLERADDPVSLGAEPWKDLWPRSIWPGDVSGIVPLALRIQSDVRISRDPAEPHSVTYAFPDEVYFLAGAPLGESVSAFVEAEWSRERGFDIEQARVRFSDVVPGLPDRALDLTVGLVNPMLLGFTDRQLDRAGRVPFNWQTFRLSRVELAGEGGDDVGPHATALGGSVAALEWSGLLGGRTQYGVGFAQPEAEAEAGVRDVYYRVRTKVGGLDYRGRYDDDGGPVAGAGGQLLDRSVTLEHFGYLGGADPAAGVGRHRAFGWAARWLAGPLDLGAGYVRRDYVRPFGALGDDAAVRTWFGKAEYLVWPWLLASAKLDRLDVDIDPASLPPGLRASGGDRRTFTPGFIALVRQNVRAILEAPLVLSGDDRIDGRRPHTLWIRLDVAF